jgi:hypothetical protein
VERFEPLASARAHAIVCVSDAELRTCLLALTDYADRVDGEHFQPSALRERLQTDRPDHSHPVGRERDRCCRADESLTPTAQ